RVAGGSERVAGPVHAEADDERAAGLQELLARKVPLVEKTRHRYFPPFAITAAACLIAVRIRGYVPQRQRWPFIAVRIWSSVGFFVVESRSAAWIIIPFWQYPQSGTCTSIQACWSGCKAGLAAVVPRSFAQSAGRPSKVVIAFPETAATGVTQERISFPSNNTEQAPHCARPQPKRGPCRCSSLCKTYSSGV